MTGWRVFGCVVALVASQLLGAAPAWAETPEPPSESTPSPRTEGEPPAETEGEPPAETEGQSSAQNVGESSAQTEGASSESDPESTPAPRTLERREVPDYSGRGPEPDPPARALLWIPRILMSPLYLIAEYVVRRPLGFIITRVEEAELPNKVIRFFQFGPENRFFLSPTLTLDLGFRANVGLYFGVDDAFTDNNDLRATYSIGGEDWHLATLTDRYRWDEERWEFGVRTRFVKRLDGRFWGLGTGVDTSFGSGFSFLGSDSEIYLERRIGEQGRFRMDTGVRFRSFGEDVIRGRPTIPDRVAQGALAEPPGYAEGYAVHSVGGEFEYDTRAKRPHPSSGFQFIVDGEFAYSLRGGASEQLWVNYGAGAGAYLDLSGVNHIVSLTLSARLVDSVNGEVPFTEQAILSGDGPMSGFLGDLLAGQSALSATLSYSWPIWVYLDGIAHVSVGNVFDRRFDGFALDQLRLSTGLGIAAVSKRDHFFELLVGFGTQTFEDGAAIDTIRVSLGGRREF